MGRRPNCRNKAALSSSPGVAWTGPEKYIQQLLSSCYSCKNSLLYLLIQRNLDGSQKMNLQHLNLTQERQTYAGEERLSLHNGRNNDTDPFTSTVDSQSIALNTNLSP